MMRRNKFETLPLIILLLFGSYLPAVADLSLFRGPCEETNAVLGSTRWAETVSEGQRLRQIESAVRVALRHHLEQPSAINRLFVAEQQRLLEQAREAQREAYEDQSALLLQSHYGPTAKVRYLASGGESVIFVVEHDVNGQSEKLVVAVPLDLEKERTTHMYQNQKEIIVAAKAADSEGGKHIVDLVELVSLGEHKIPGMVTKLAQRGSLNNLLPNLGPETDPKILLDYWRQIALGLRALHATGKIHLDLKPSNILIHQDANTALPTLKIADFGFSSGENSPSQGGTPSYMHEDRWRDDVGASKIHDGFSFRQVCRDMISGGVAQQFNAANPANHVTKVWGKYHIFEALPDSIAARADPTLVKFVDNANFDDIPSVIAEIDRLAALPAKKNLNGAWRLVPE
jgi:serine/threonine protein kinase